MPSNNRRSIFYWAISYLPQPLRISTAINKRLTIFRDSVFPPDPTTAAQIKQIQEKLSYDDLLQRNAIAVAEFNAPMKPPAADTGSLYSKHTISSTSSLPFSLVSRDVAIRREKAKAESVSRFSTTSTISPTSPQSYKPRKLQKRGHPSYPHESFIPAWRQLWYVDRERAKRIIAARMPKSALKPYWSESLLMGTPSRTSSIWSTRSQKLRRMDSGRSFATNRTTQWKFDEEESSVFNDMRRLNTVPPSFHRSMAARARVESGSFRSQQSHSLTPPPAFSSKIISLSRNNSVRSVNTVRMIPAGVLKGFANSAEGERAPIMDFPVEHLSRTDRTRSTRSIKEEKAAKRVTSWAALTEGTGLKCDLSL